MKMRKISCPYMENCNVKFKKVIDCCTKRHLNCIKYQELSIFELNRIVKGIAVNIKGSKKNEL